MKKLVLLTLMVGFGSCGVAGAQSADILKTVVEPSLKVTASAAGGGNVKDATFIQAFMHNIDSSKSGAGLYGGDIWMMQKSKGKDFDTAKNGFISDAKSVGNLVRMYHDNLTNPLFGKAAIVVNLLDYQSSVGWHSMDNLGSPSPAEAAAIARSQVDFSVLISSQNQVIIEQNQKVIALLTKIANKK